MELFANIMSVSATALVLAGNPSPHVNQQVADVSLYGGPVSQLVVASQPSYKISTKINHSQDLVRLINKVGQLSKPDTTSQVNDNLSKDESSDKAKIVKVESGDSLSKIAKAEGTTWRRLFDKNTFIKNPNIIHPGDEVTIPSDDEKLKHRNLPRPAASTAKPTTKTDTTTPTRHSAAKQSVTSTSASSGGVWDQIASCESGGNWSINTGNGYYGGLQFDHSTWIANGGGKYANNANGATKAQQIEIANNTRAHRGLQPWECATILGLR